MNQCAFLSSIRLQPPDSHTRKCCFYLQAPNPLLIKKKKKIDHVVRELAKTAQEQIAPFHSIRKKFSGDGSVSVGCHTYCWPNSVKLHWVILPCKKQPASCSFQKTQIMHHSCSHSTQKNNPVCSPGWFEAATLLTQESFTCLVVLPGIPTSRWHTSVHITS